MEETRAERIDDDNDIRKFRVKDVAVISAMVIRPDDVHLIVTQVPHL